MLLLFFGGVMNLLWVGAITIFVLLEKATPFGRHAAKVSGASMIVLAVVLLATHWQFFRVS